MFDLQRIQFIAVTERRLGIHRVRVLYSRPFDRVQFTIENQSKLSDFFAGN